jgi:phosphoenolpyruvate-protein phosphotransferase
VVVGPAYVLHPELVDADSTRNLGSPDEELTRWLTARESVVDALVALTEHARKHVGPAEAEIFEAQREMASDPELAERVSESIRNGASPEKATRDASTAYAAQLSALDDPYLRLRADDIREVARGLRQALAGKAPFDIVRPPPRAIVCAETLPAAVVVRLDRSTLGGIALGNGGATSHVAILARTLGVPAVLGLGDALRSVQDTDILGLNGDTGQVHVNPTGATLEKLQRAVQARLDERTALASLALRPAITPDGHTMDLWANIGGARDVAPALAAGATGVGLLRTEFLIAGRRTLPSEDEQFATYVQIADTLGERPLVIRTFDIGGDKPVPALRLPSEANPFLGYRAIRIGLAQPELLRTQLRAILRVAKMGYPVSVMLPMVATLDEVLQAREILNSVASAEAVSVALGIMIEIPSAALNASALAREVDFFSIGTNDLTQYTLATDRTDERLASLYQPLHPAVLRLIEMTATAAISANIPCGVCGELAGDPRATAVLVGLGVTELSMNAGSLGAVKREVLRTPWTAARELAADVLQQDATEAVVARITAFFGQLKSGR